MTVVFRVQFRLFNSRPVCKTFSTGDTTITDRKVQTSRTELMPLKVHEKTI